MPRNLIVPAAVAFLAVVLSAVALFDPREDRLDIEIEVFSASDPFEINAITSLKVGVKNNSASPIRPRFSIQWSSYPIYWRITSGPDELPGGESAVYQLEAPDATGTAPDGLDFQVRVNNAGSIVYAVSEPITSAIETPPIVNPRFSLWSKQFFENAVYDRPFGWEAYRRLGDGDDATVTRTIVNGEPAVFLELTQDGERDENDWAQAGLLQEIPFPDSPIAITTRATAPYEANARGWPLKAFGVEFSDNENPLLWVLFQDGQAEDYAYALPNGHYIIVLSIPSEEWVTKEIDVAAIYEELGWEAQEDLLVNVFVAATSTSLGRISGVVQEINVSAESAVLGP